MSVCVCVCVLDSEIVLTHTCMLYGNYAYFMHLPHMHLFYRHEEGGRSLLCTVIVLTWTQK